MRRYNQYKDSGVEWMGDIPSHWILTKNRYGFIKYRNGSNSSEQEDRKVNDPDKLSREGGKCGPKCRPRG